MEGRHLHGLLFLACLQGCTSASFGGELGLLIDTEGNVGLGASYSHSYGGLETNHASVSVGQTFGATVLSDGTLNFQARVLRVDTLVSQCSETPWSASFDFPVLQLSKAPGSKIEASTGFGTTVFVGTHVSEKPHGSSTEFRDVGLAVRATGLVHHQSREAGSRFGATGFVGGGFRKVTLRSNQSACE